MPSVTTTVKKPVLSALPTYPSTISPFIFDPNGPEPEPDWIYDGFLCRSNLALWLGREKHRKTNVALQLMMCAALGRDFLWLRNVHGRPARVVYLDYESTTFGLHQRYPALCASMGLGPEDLVTLQENLKIIEIRRILQDGLDLPHFPTKPDLARLGWWERFIEANPAEIYVIDPLRSFHGSDENDSTIEQLLTQLRRTFKNSALILLHHMRKNSDGGSQGRVLRLHDDMRTWSDGCRGSGAMKAHADLILCQERIEENGDERVWLGAFMKDGADIQPTALEESDARSFYWCMASSIPDHLRTTVELLKRGGPYKDYSSARHTLTKMGVKRATAYLHLQELKAKGFFVQSAANTWILKLRDTVSSSSRIQQNLKSMFAEDFEPAYTL